MGSNPAYRTTQFRSRRCESIGGFVFVGQPFLGRPATAGGFGGKRRTFFKVFFAFSLLTCYAFIPDVRGSTEMTNPIRRQIQEHPACDTHRPRPHAEGFLRRSGREVECTPLLRVQVQNAGLEGSNPSFSATNYKNCSFVISGKHLKLQWIKGLKRLSFKPFFLSVDILQHAYKITKQNLL